MIAGRPVEHPPTGNGHGGHVRTTNGLVDRFDHATEISAPWKGKIFLRNFFPSLVESETFKLSFQYLGREKLTVAAKGIEVEHYRMVGDEARDVWFDVAGHVAKVGLRRQGSRIAYVRDQLVPREPRSGPCACRR